MRKLRSPIKLAALSLAMFALSFSPGRAADILVNGGLEEGAGPQNWTLTQSTAATSPPGDFNGNGIVDAADYVALRKNNQPLSDYNLWRSNFGTVATGLPVAATELVTDAQEPPATVGLGLLVKPYAGNEYPYPDQNLPINFSMSQVFTAGPSAPGKTYTFSGDSQYQGAIRGISIRCTPILHREQSPRRRRPNTNWRSSTSRTICWAPRYSICPNIGSTRAAVTLRPGKRTACRPLLPQTLSRCK